MKATYMFGAGDVRVLEAYIEQLLPAVLDGIVQPGKVFDRTVGLGQAPEGYAAMDARDALKVAVRP